MVHEGIFATSGATMTKAGLNHPDIDEDEMNELHKQAESQINCLTRNNWSDSYGTLDSDVQGILSEISSNLTAIYLISYDMSGYTSRIEAEDMVNILRDAALRGMSILKDKKVEDFMDAA